MADANVTVTVHTIQRHLDRLGEIIARIDAWRAEQQAQAEPTAEEATTELCHEILEDAPTEYDCDGDEQAVAVRYVRDLETRLAKVTKLHAQLGEALTEQ